MLLPCLFALSILSSSPLTPDTVPAVVGPSDTVPTLRPDLAATPYQLLPSGIGYLAPDTVRAGSIATPDSATAAVPTPHSPHYLRSSLGIGLVVSLGMAHYFNDKSLQDNDWRVRSVIHNRLFSTRYLRFDDNHFRVNNRDHIAAGTAYYRIARTNHLSAGNSLVATLIASSVWEYIVEMREVVSINDQVFTTVGGAVLGEVIYQNEMFFQRASAEEGHWMLSKILGFPISLATSRAAAERRGSREDLDRWWHGSFVYGGTAQGRDGDDQLRPIAGFQSEVQNIADADKPGEERRFIGGTPISRLLFEGSATATAGQIRLAATAAPFGWFWKNIALQPTGGTRGYRLFVGPASGYQVVTGTMTGGKDAVAVVNLAGPMIDAVLHGGAVRARLHARSSVDLSMITASALPLYQEQFSLDSAQSVLRRHGYYHAYGLGGAGMASVEAGGWEIGAEVASHHAYSIMGLDRYPEQATHPLSMRDQRTQTAVWGGFSPGPITFQVRWERESRGGEVESLQLKQRAARLSARLLVPL